MPARVYGESAHWRRNLAVCAAGSFTTIVSMTLLLPYLPVYVARLGVTDPAAVTRWSGVAYAATFFTAALTAPLWGTLADRYGRKPMLLRASLGMAVAMSLMGLAQNVGQLVALRLLAGLLGGYASGSTALVAAQTPRAHTARSLGLLSAGIMAGNVVGPLVGGWVPEVVGIRATFFAVGALIFVAFLGTWFLLDEDGRPAEDAPEPASTDPGDAADDAGTDGERGARPAVGARTPAPAADPVPRHRIAALLVTAMLLMVATVSAEPVLTVYVARLDHGGLPATGVSGIVFALSAVGTILSAPALGRLADRVGHTRTICACLAATAVLLALQAGARTAVELGALRLITGLALGGLLPSVTAALRHAVPDTRVGRVLGYSVSAQYVGQVLGPVAGGWVAGRWGIPAVFLGTSAVVLVGLVVMVLSGRGATPRA